MRNKPEERVCITQTTKLRKETKNGKKNLNVRIQQHYKRTIVSYAAINSRRLFFNAQVNLNSDINRLSFIARINRNFVPEKIAQESMTHAQVTSASFNYQILESVSPL